MTHRIIMIAGLIGALFLPLFSLKGFYVLPHLYDSGKKAYQNYPLLTASAALTLTVGIGYISDGANQVLKITGNKGLN